MAIHTDAVLLAASFLRAGAQVALIAQLVDIDPRTLRQIAKEHGLVISSAEEVPAADAPAKSTPKGAAARDTEALLRNKQLAFRRLRAAVGAQPVTVLTREIQRYLIEKGDA